MTHLKPILAMTSMGCGAALLLMSAYIARERFAFTSQAGANFDATLETRVLEPSPPIAIPEPGFGAPEPTIVIEALDVRAERPPALRKPVVQPTPAVVPPPCRPAWRALESGPVGREVREICQPAPAAGLPQS
jgi:hypothetical protein